MRSMQHNKEPFPVRTQQVPFLAEVAFAILTAVDGVRCIGLTVLAVGVLLWLELP
jgi:hypothetical protein